VSRSNSLAVFRRSAGGQSEDRSSTTVLTGRIDQGPDPPACPVFSDVDQTRRVTHGARWCTSPSNYSTPRLVTWLISQSIVDDFVRIAYPPTDYCSSVLSWRLYAANRLMNSINSLIDADVALSRLGRRPFLLRR